MDQQGSTPALSRRRFLSLTLMTGAAVSGTALLAACGGQAPAPPSAGSSGNPNAGPAPTQAPAAPAAGNPNAGPAPAAGGNPNAGPAPDAQAPAQKPAAAPSDVKQVA